MEQTTQQKDSNVIYIGKKSTMGYVLAVVTQFNSGAKEVYVKARGKLISHAVDVAEIVRNRFLPDVKIASILTKTEELDSEDGTKSKVSAIEIKLAK
ncbi:MAG: DNA-binding protein Alba [Candidatus Anstonellaceae archaeon]